MHPQVNPILEKIQAIAPSYEPNIGDHLPDLKDVRLYDRGSSGQVTAKKGDVWCLSVLSGNDALPQEACKAEIVKQTFGLQSKKRDLELLCLVKCNLNFFFGTWVWPGQLKPFSVCAEFHPNFFARWFVGSEYRVGIVDSRDDNSNVCCVPKGVL